MSTKRRALITGINGMDGSHLADLLLEKGYEVFGLERRNSYVNRRNTAHIADQITFLQGDMTDKSSLDRVLRESEPHEVYNLAAQSFVGSSWNLAEQTSKVNALGVLNLLEAIRAYSLEVRLYQASSSEMFGKAVEVPQSENTPFYPRSPYGVSKLYAHWMAKNFRESYDMYICCGLLFNHESERRGHEFVTRKITDGVARIRLGLTDHISLGNLDAKRDWGYAPDYVDAMWRMLQQDRDYFHQHKVGEFVVATGETHSVREFLDAAFRAAEIEDWEKYVRLDPRFMRPAEVDLLLGDPSKAKRVLGWEPKTTFEELVRRMTRNDLELVQKEIRANAAS